MPELKDVKDLEERLAALRQQIAAGTARGYTSLQIQQLRRHCHHLWAQIELHRREQLATVISRELTPAQPEANSPRHGAPAQVSFRSPG
ncbi:MAG TPA: hypothetical protein VKX28_06895 [Xanthobacteraceae bacterium]|jgi:cell division septum initiation protein DivIVA|nr:hypothetical protein [Xanthobacteraceae bacterium]